MQLRHCLAIVFALFAPPASGAGYKPRRTACNVPSGSQHLVLQASNVTQASMMGALDTAKQFWSDAANVNTSFVISIPAGTFALNDTLDQSAVLIMTGSTHQDVAGSGRLFIKGAGVQKTTLVFNKAAIRGRGIQRLTFCNFYMKASRETASQGTVLGFTNSADASQQILLAPAADTDSIVFQADEGFPTIASGFHPKVNYDTSMWGKFVGAYEQLANGTVNYDDNRYSAYNNAIALDAVRDLITVNHTCAVKNMKLNDTVVVKTKEFGNGIWLLGGQDIQLLNLRVTGCTRMAFRGVDNVLVDNLLVDRQLPNAILASSAGGLQLGNMNNPDHHVSNITVRRSTFIGMGDDPVALFSVVNAYLSDIFIQDAFVRGILFDQNCQSVCADDNLVLQNSSIQSANDTLVWTCTPYQTGKQLRDANGEDRTRACYKN